MRMEAKETTTDPHLKPAVTIHPKDFSPQTLERIPADPIDWQSSTIQERKERHRTIAAEESSTSQSIEHHTLSTQQLPSKTEQVNSKGDGLVILSIVLHVLGIFVVVIGIFGAAFGFTYGGTIALVGLALIVLSYILFYRGLADNLVSGHKGSDRSPSYYRRKGLNGFLISILISLLGGLTVLGFGVIYWIVHRQFANYLEDTSK